MTRVLPLTELTSTQVTVLAWVRRFGPASIPQVQGALLSESPNAIRQAVRDLYARGLLSKLSVHKRHNKYEAT